MHMRKRMVLLAILFFTICHAAVISIASYPWLKVYYTGTAKIFNTTCDKLSRDDPFYYAQGDTTGFIKVMEYVPDADEGTLYSILFSIGESGDAHYLFYREGAFDEPVFIIFCDHLYFSGDGMIVAKGIMNEMFERSRKYELKNGKIKEISQPFYGVNMLSYATRDFDIYQTKRLKRPLASVQKGEDVQVLIAEFKDPYSFYLIRTVSGLTGWVRIEKGIWIDETPIKDLYYHGD
ncbi:MAG: SH3 domain-containing protein [FCB group bacterium]|nr:SH3 domain-containing protein [FCB group bacterium]